MRILFVSPHLDDAVFSCGGIIARLTTAGHDVTILTVFAATVPAPSGFALACQLDKGLGPDIDYMALRREEDRSAARALGAYPVHLVQAEAPHRGYESADALFGAVRPDDPASTAVPRGIAPFTQGAELVFGPAGFGDHVDHLIVRDALHRTTPGDRLILWRDLPYALRAPTTPPFPPHRVSMAAHADRKPTACAAYASQIGFQFGGAEAMAAALATDPQTAGEAEIVYPASEESRRLLVAILQEPEDAGASS